MKLNSCYTFVFLFTFLFIFESAAQISVNGKLYTLDECIKAASDQEKQMMYRESSAYLNAAASYLWEAKEYNEAISLFERSIVQNQKINNKSGVARIESNLAMIYADKGDYQKSLFYFEKTLAVREAEKEKVAIIAAKINISITLNRLNRYDESIAHLMEALKMAGDLNDKSQMQTCYGMLAETYEKKGDRKSAMLYFDYYKATHEDIQKNHEKRVQAALDKVNNDIALTQSEKEQKEVQLRIREKELEEKKRALERYDSTNKELSMRASEIELKLELLQKEEAINALRRQEIEKSLKQEKTFTLMAVIVLGIALVFLIFIGMTLRSNKKMNRLLTERNEIILGQKQRMEEENKVRTKLLSILSHDFRTPLSGVHLMVQLLRSKSLPPEMIDRQLGKLDESLSRSFQMLENMLYWTKNQMNGIIFKPEYVSLSVIVVDNLKLFTSNILDKNIEVDNQVGLEDDVYADKEMVNSIIRNLIANAVKFTPKGGKISLSSAKKSNNRIVFSIRDTGVGMSESQKSKIFTTEVQSTHGTEKETGTGLGLVLCHDFALACKGKITFESQEGTGTCFYLELPTEAEHA